MQVFCHFYADDDIYGRWYCQLDFGSKLTIDSLIMSSDGFVHS
jgi:hypothetical protein